MVPDWCLTSVSTLLLVRTTSQLVSQQQKINHRFHIWSFPAKFQALHGLLKCRLQRAALCSETSHQDAVGEKAFAQIWLTSLHPRAVHTLSATRSEA